ncbi:MAG TPA: M55 family metallopeptidase [Solirubrobacter sp.]|nr:M55 family metallopeptidase [Solirubrobacter sp.]
MRVLIISDMEGVAGISRWDQVSADKPGYEEGRRLYTAEINATVRGAFAGGATEVVVMDCHGAGGDRSFNSLIPDALDERCEFVVQHQWTEYTAMLEQGCDAALFVGQHARAGAERGVLSHTVSSTSWYELRFNGAPVGEVAINAALCGTWGCPVALVTGDDVVCEEATELLGSGLRTLAVKTALGRFSARHLSPAAACSRLEQAAAAALRNVGGAPVYDPGAPCTIAVELATPDHADKYRNRAGVVLTGPRSVESRAGSWWDAWRALYL